MGQGGAHGHRFVVDKIGERMGMMGQGGGCRLAINKIGRRVVYLFGRGGGCELIINEGGEGTVCLIGQGGRQDWAIGYGVLCASCASLRVASSAREEGVQGWGWVFASVRC